MFDELFVVPVLDVSFVSVLVEEFFEDDELDLLAKQRERESEKCSRSRF